jgi:hypothetical protein
MNATTNQIIAMCFPLLTVAVVWLVALYVRRRWGRSRSTPEFPIDVLSTQMERKGEEVSITADPENARRLLSQAQRKLQHNL